MADEVAALLKQVYGPEPARGEKRPAELKSYDPPWLDQMYYKINDEVFGKYANARDLDTTKRWTNAALAAWPVAGPILNRVPNSVLAPGALFAGMVRPSLDAITKGLSGVYLPTMFSEFGEPITDVADPKRQYEPAQRESANAVHGSDGKWTRQDWETAMYGQEGEPGFDTAMLAGPRERTPPNLNLDRVLLDSEYATPKYPTRAEGGPVPEPVLRGLNTFAEGAGDLVNKAGDQLTDPNLLLHEPWKRPSLVTPAALRMMSLFVRDMAQRGISPSAPDDQELLRKRYGRAEGGPAVSSLNPLIAGILARYYGDDNG